MKALRLRFDDGNEKTVHASDSDIRCVRSSDDLVVGDLCRYSLEGQLLTAEVIDVFDIKVEPPIIESSTLSSFEQRILDELRNIRGVIKNDVGSAIRKFSSVVQASLMQRAQNVGQNVPNPPCATPDLQELFPEEANNNSRSRSPTRKRRCSDSEAHSSNQGEKELPEVFHGRSNNQTRPIDQPPRKRVFGQITDTLPTDAQIQVQTSSGSYVPVKTVSFDDLIKAFQAKWKNTRLAPISQVVDIQLAVQRLHKPCIRAFQCGNARAFMYPISCYLFDMDVIRAAFLPARASAFHKRNRPSKDVYRRDLNEEAQDAFYFLVDYFSTILIDPRDAEHALWPLVVRNSFNRTVGDLNKREARDANGLVVSTSNSFMSYVIPRHVPVFNYQTAF